MLLWTKLRRTDLVVKGHFDLTKLIFGYIAKLYANYFKISPKWCLGIKWSADILYPKGQFTVGPSCSAETLFWPLFTIKIEERQTVTIFHIWPHNELVTPWNCTDHQDQLCFYVEHFILTFPMNSIFENLWLLHPNIYVWSITVHLISLVC